MPSICFSFTGWTPPFREAEQFGLLADLRAEGKIRSVGLSEVDVETIERARRIVPIVSVQNRYNVQDRRWDPVVDHCEREGLAFIPWYPLAAGWLRSPVVERVAARHHATPMQIALAWLLARSPQMMLIPGTSKVAHLEENMRAAEFVLAPEDLSELESVGPPQPSPLGRLRRMFNR